MSVRSSSRAATFAAVVAAATLGGAHQANAFIGQVDGTVVPQTTRMQQCLDLPATAETTPGAVDQVADAAVTPEAYRPVLDTASGRYRVTFVDIGEGAGFRNSFGWFWTDEDPSDPANLHTVFGCRTYGTCDCPCTTTRTVTVDMDLEAGFAVGRTIGLWLRTPENLDGSRENGTYDTGLGYCTASVGCDPNVPNLNDSCGGRLDTNNRIYFTSNALNDDGDFVHFLVYRSATRTNTFYFGFEDLFRGGDNDFEDMLVRATGLVPLCDPQPEVCNGVDDDCDMGVDEGVVEACATACGSGVRECTGGSFGACSAPSPTGEACNALDDDCDGTVDEGLDRACSNSCGSGTEICDSGSFVDCNAPTPSIESCNGDDDDCDGLVDEGITRACFTGCGSGTETCTAGTFGGCTAPTPGSETCNGTDDDCDGLTDEGLTRSCMSACGTGNETCISGAFVGCTAPTPALEACNDTDDDCDGLVDEGITRTCSTSCGTGTETCAAGVFGGCDAPTPGAEVCNNVDDDCNGVIDDGNPGGGELCVPTEDGGFTIVTDPGTPTGDVCVPGQVRCIAGVLSCVGASSTTREVCNCSDDDCDGTVDEGVLCPGGACIDCTCVSPCGGTEFGCPPGRVCDMSLADPSMDVIGYCVAGECDGVTCSDEEVCDPGTGECQNLCEGVTCRDGFACVRGACVEDNCYGRGCPPGERCRNAACEADPCVGVVCDGASYCRDGTCVTACDVACVVGEVCQDGACVADQCAAPCSASESCVDGACVAAECSPACGLARVCRGDICIDDPCLGIDCPGGTTCELGSCAPPTAPPGEEPVMGLATGRGGCSCQVPGGTSSDGGPAGFLALLGLLGLLWFRRRSSAGARRTIVTLTLAALAAPSMSGCDVDPFCFEGCDDAGVDASDDAGEDAAEDAMDTDGCVAVGEETCNGIDDDCDGVADEDFDLATDPGHCGACDQACVLPSAFPACVAGACAIDMCEIGFHDLNENPTDGCEYACPPSGDEICDERDNDCDGATDEGFDLTSELANCGACGTVCAFPNATASCEASACAMGICNAGFVDVNAMADDGCEYACTPIAGELCNSVDDDCDMAVDEDFDLLTDPNNCGVCGVACVFPNATGECVGGLCAVDVCDAGFEDIDGDPTTGCEYPCVVSGAGDGCNGVDDDCDGAVDESDPDVGSACGSSSGACSAGVRACQLGALACIGGRGPTPETCNGLDDDCDGTTDESTAAAPIPGVGVRCGETNVGACAFGTVVCAGGSLGCGGSYVPAAPETCNGVDDDCDGTIDDSPSAPAATPASCAATAGVCAGRTPECMGAGGWECTFGASYQPVETTCDMLDNDCDGSADELCLSPEPATDRRVDTGDGATEENSVQPILSGDGADRVYAAWMDLRGAGEAHVLFNRSTDGGDTWGSSTLLDSASGAAIGPRFGVTGASRDDVVALWSDFRGGTSFREVFRSFSTDSGGAFGGDARINPGQNSDSFNLDVAVDGADVYAVYENFTTDRSRHIFILRSPDGGSTWGSVAQVDNGSGATFVAATPQVAAEGGSVHVIWRDNRNGALDIYTNRAAPTGGNAVTPAGADTRLDVGTAPGASSSFSPVIAAEGSNVYAAWVDDRLGGSFDIWTNKSNDGGATWLSADSVRIDADPLAHDSIAPQLVAPSAAHAVVAWVDFRFGFPDIQVSVSDDAGGSYSAPQRADTGTGPGTAASFDLTLDGAGSLIAVAWADDRAGFLDIYGNFSLDGGVTWQPQDYRLDSSTLGTSDSERPQVYVSGSAAHVVWVDHRRGASCPSGSASDPSCPNGDIYYRRLQ